MTDLTDRLIDITCETLEIDREGVSGSTRFVEDLGADSVDCVEMMMATEDAFGIEFPDDDLANLLTIADVADYIRRASGGRSSGRTQFAAAAASQPILMHRSDVAA